MSAQTLHDVSIEWSHAHFYATKRWQEAQDKARDEWIGRLEAKLHKRRLEKNAAAQAAALASATSGPGWKVIDAPDEPHEELERLAKEAWDRVFHAIPWPTGWRVRWGSLRPTALGEVVLGMAVSSARLILLDQTAQRSRTMDQRLQTVLHELCHVVHPAEVHGPGWTETFKRVVDFMFGAPARPLAANPHPAPVKGRRFDGRPVEWLGAGEWEFRG